MRDVVFRPDAWGDIRHWAEADTKLLARILKLIEECRRTPFTGTGKPEPLRGDMKGAWSRRINDRHRLVYAVTTESIIVVGARFHYER